MTSKIKTVLAGLVAVTFLSGAVCAQTTNTVATRTYDLKKGMCLTYNKIGLSMIKGTTPYKLTLRVVMWVLDDQEKTLEGEPAFKLLYETQMMTINSDGKTDVALQDNMTPPRIFIYPKTGSRDTEGLLRLPFLPLPGQNDFVTSDGTHVKVSMSVDGDTILYTADALRIGVSEQSAKETLTLKNGVPQSLDLHLKGPLVEVTNKTALVKSETFSADEMTSQCAVALELADLMANYNMQQIKESATAKAAALNKLLAFLQKYPNSKYLSLVNSEIARIGRK